MAPTVSVPCTGETLKNGLRVLLHEDRRLPVVHVALWYHVGSRNERPWRTGFAHLFEHLMFEGSRNNPAHFIKLMEKAGASLAAGGVNGTTSHDRTNYYETVPREALPLVLWAESDRMAWLLDVLDRKRLDTQREVVRNERFQRMDNVPYGTAWEQMFRALFPAGHPYSWDVIGELAHLDAASLAEVKDFFRTWYAPNNAVLVVAGDYDEEAALGLIRRYFGSIPPGSLPGRPEAPAPVLETTRRVVMPEEVPHARLYCGWPTVPFFHRDEPALDLLSDVLSDGLNSRLYRRMVYEDRLASGVNAFNYSLEAGGVAGVVATARPGIPLARLREAMDEELKRMATEGPAGEELDRVKAATQVAFVGALERLASKADMLARYTTFLGDPNRISEHWLRYRAVTASDLRDAAGRYLLRPRVEMVYGEPEAEGEPPAELAPIGPGEWREPAKTPAPPSRELPPEPDRSLPPPPVRSGQFEPPLPQVRRLQAGAGVHVVKRSALPKVVGTLRIPGGKVDEPRRLAGLAGLTAQMLLRGTKSRSAREFEAEAARIGAAIRAAAGAESLHLSFSCLTEHLEKTLELAADLLENPAFLQEELERIVPLRLDGLKQARANPNVVARRIVRRTLFSDRHAYGWSPDEASLQAINTDDMARYHESRFTPAEADFVVCGDLEAARAVALLEEHFGRWAGSSVGEVSAGAPGPPRAETGVLFHATGKETPQAVVVWRKQGPPRAAPDQLALRVALQVLGGGFSSRLNLNLRERMGATYGAFAGARQLARASAVTASASLNLDQAEEGIRELLAEIEALQSGRRPITGEELAEAKVTLTRTYIQRFETLGGLRGVISGVLHRGEPLSEIRDFPGRIAALSRRQVQRAASRHLTGEGSALVVVGNRDRLVPALETLDFGPVQELDADGAPLGDLT